MSDAIVISAAQKDRTTALASPPNVAVQRPTRVGANFAQAKFVTTKEVRCNGVLGGDANAP